MLVDLGRYTVDFSGFKILDDNNNLEQLIVSESIELGSNIINEKIVDIIKFVYGESAIETLKKNHYYKWERMLFDIERTKIAACNRYIVNEYIKLIVEFDYLKFSNCSSLINKKLCEKTYEGTKIKFSESEIYIKRSLIKSTVINIARNLSNKISIINNQLKNENFSKYYYDRWI